MILMHFTDAVPLRGRFTYKTEPMTPVPTDILNLWQSRGYQASATGIALVTFDETCREYIYPLYFWSE